MQNRDKSFTIGAMYYIVRSIRYTVVVFGCECVFCKHTHSHIFSSHDILEREKTASKNQAIFDHCVDISERMG